MALPRQILGPVLGIVAIFGAGYVVLRTVPTAGDIVGPVLGIGAIISFMVAGIAVLRLLPPRRAQLQGEESQALDEVRARLSELDLMNQRVAELEERVDFAERLLAKRPEEDRAGLPRATDQRI